MWYSPLALLDPGNIHRVPAENIKLIVLENVAARAEQGSWVWLQLPGAREGEKKSRGVREIWSSP